MARERFDTSQKPEKLPTNIPVVETSLFQSHKALCESGAFEVLGDLSASVEGSGIAFASFPEDKDTGAVAGVSLSFTFANRNYVPRMSDRPPWQVWYRCEARSQQDSNTVDLIVKQVSSEKGEQGNNYRYGSWKDGKWENLDEVTQSAQKLKEAITPDTGIDRELYEGFNGDLMVAVEHAGNDRMAFKRLMDEILNFPDYRPIVERHFGFHLKKGQK